jgi:hypothetical protein
MEVLKMWWMYLGFAANLIKKGLKWKSRVEQPGSPGGTTIVGEEWAELAGDIIDAFAEAFGFERDEAAAGLFEGMAGYLERKS